MNKYDFIVTILLVLSTAKENFKIDFTQNSSLCDATIYVYNFGSSCAYNSKALVSTIVFKETNLQYKGGEIISCNATCGY